MRIVSFIATLLLGLLSPKIAAQGLCDTLALPIYESFEGYGDATIPPCWTVSLNYDLGAVPSITHTVYNGGTSSLLLYSGTLAGSHYSMTILPPMQENGGTEWVRFHYLSSTMGASIEVGLCDDTGRYTRHFLPLDTVHVTRPNRWEEILVPLPPATDSYRRVAFRLQRGLQSEAVTCYLDDISIGSCGVSRAWVTQLTSHSLTLDWERYGEEALDISWEDGSRNNVFPPLTIDGLDSSTSYTFNLGCEGGVGLTITATTLEGVNKPSTYYLSSLSTTLPNGWHITTHGDSTLYVFPLINRGNINDLHLSLSLHGTEGTRLVVGRMDYALEPTSFYPLDTFVCHATTEQHTITLTAPSSEGAEPRIALLSIGEAAVVEHIRVARCMVENVRLYDLSDTAVTITWDTLWMTDGGDVMVSLTPRDTSLNDAITVRATNNPFILHGLTPMTSYNLYVYSACEDSICDYDKHTFSTFAHRVEEPYCCHVEGLPQGWVKKDNITCLPRIESLSDSLVLEIYAAGHGTLEVGNMEDPYSTFRPLASSIGHGVRERYLFHLPMETGYLLALRSATPWTIMSVALHRDAILDATISSLSGHHATVQWSTLLGDSVEVEYRAVGSAVDDFAPGDGILVHAFDSIELDNLNAGSYYAIHIRPLSDIIDNDCQYYSLTLLTDAIPAALPLCENFDASAAYPSSWRRLSQYGEYPIVSTERNHSQRHALRFSANAANHTIALLPPIESPSSTLTLAFWSNCMLRHSGAQLIVGRMSNPTEIASFLPYDTITFNSSDTWRHHIVVLDNQDTTLGLIAFMLVGGSDNETRLFLDDLCVESCAVAGLRAESTDSTSVTFAWESHGDAALLIRREGSSQTDTFYTSPGRVEGLSPNWSYLFSFETLCSCGDHGGIYITGTSGKAENDRILYGSIRTRQGRVTPPFCYTFEEYAASTRPSSLRHFGSNMAVSDHTYHDGSRSLSLDSATTLVLPYIDAPQDLAFTFWLYSTTSGLDLPGAVDVGVMRNPDSAATFLPLVSLTGLLPGRWQRHAIDLAATPDGYHHLAIRTAIPLFLDDINVSFCATDSVTASEDGMVRWQPIHSPTKVAIEYGPRGFTLGEGVVDTTISSPYILPNRIAGERYDIYLTAFCDSSSECLPTHITTGNAAALPYCEGFEQSTLLGLPDEWLTGRTFNNTPAIITKDGSNHLFLKAHTTAVTRSLVAMPQLSVGASAQFSCSIRSITAGGALIMGHTDATADPNTFVPIDTMFCPTDGQWHRHYSILNNLPVNRKIALCAFSSHGEATIWVDSLSVTHATTPEVRIINAHSLMLLSEDRNYYIEYGPGNFVQGNGTLLHVDSGRYLLSTLQPGESYTLYLRDDSATVTCMTPLSVTLPSETPLPYCLHDTTFHRLLLPEFTFADGDTLHLYLSAENTCTIVVGTMNHSEGWEEMTIADTLTIDASSHLPSHVAISLNGASFVGLCTLRDAHVTLRHLTATNSRWVTARLQNDNSVLLEGNGTIEYGEEGFVPGSGTTVTVAGSLVLDNLDENSHYDYYPLFYPDTTMCYPPLGWTTSTMVTLPYCTSFESGLPEGWDGGTSYISDSNLVLTSDDVIALPFLDADAFYLQINYHLSSSGTALIVNLDTLRNLDSGWHTLTLYHEGHDRITIGSLGSGILKLHHVEATTCGLPSTLHITHPGDGATLLSWDTNEVSHPFYVHYRIADSEDPYVCAEATISPLTLHLNPGATYEISSSCDPHALSCRILDTITTLVSPASLPYCTSLTVTELTPLPQPEVDSLRHVVVAFDAHTLQRNASLTLGVMSDLSDPTSFDSLTSFAIESSTQRYEFSLERYYGHSRFLALRSDDNTVVIDHLLASLCTVRDICLSETGPNHAVVSWQQHGNPNVNIYYRPISAPAADQRILTHVTSPCRIDSLQGLTDYIFIVSTSCNEECLGRQFDTLFLFTPKGGSGCIDYTDLHAPYVVCYYGKYSHADAHEGCLDYGFRSASSRHTVHFDTTEYDARSGGLLRTVPPGAVASVRLGNWLTGGADDAEAESIVYGMTVDTTEADLLVLKYAAVLQDPEHHPNLQPRFRLAILNEQGALVDQCGMADFIANPALVGTGGAHQQWNVAPGEVLWKDWTTVGLDITAYHGQTIYIQLTTYDCGEGSHFGYAYFTLECATKRMQVEGCSTVPDNCFTVPSGFNYQWYSNLNPDTESDSSTLCVISDNNLIYYCRLSFIDNPACYFTMSAFSGARYPLAIIDSTLTVAGCQYDLLLSDHSTISADGIHPVGTGEHCETRRWLLSDGSEQNGQNVSVHMVDTGLYSITLIAGIADDQCLDTLQHTFHITRPFPSSSIEGPSSHCDNAVADTLYVRGATNYIWADGSSTCLAVRPLADSTYSCYTIDTNGCRDTLHHMIHVMHSYRRTDHDTVCQNMGGYRWQDTTVSVPIAGTDMHSTRHLTTVEGCDSTLTLALHLLPTYEQQHYDTLCYESQRVFFDTLLTTTGEYSHRSSTLAGCDSVVTLFLNIIPRRYTNDRRQVCDSLLWTDGIIYRNDTIGPHDTLRTVHDGCDSVTTLYLVVHHATSTYIADTFCQGTIYHFRDRELTGGGHYSDTLSTVSGCDSVIGITLTCLPLPQMTLAAEYSCSELQYTVTGVSDMSYNRWQTEPTDNTVDSVNYHSSFIAEPTINTRYILVAAYDSTQLCARRDTLLLTPAVAPLAVLQVNPLALTSDELFFTAYDMGSDYNQRRWYVDGEEQISTGRTLYGQGNALRDSTEIVLIVNDGRCEDTATHVLTILHGEAAMPNAFLPDAESNNRFFFRLHGVISGEIRIFNRNGMLVFSSNDIHAAWDGRNQHGDPCPTGNYVWKVRFRTEAHPTTYQEQTGTVLLIR